MSPKFPLQESLDDHLLDDDDADGEGSLYSPDDEELEDEEDVDKDEDSRDETTEEPKETSQVGGQKQSKAPREKNLQCQYCPATFFRPDRLRTHIDVNHVHILRYQCPTCGESFGSQPYLSKHLRRMHQQKTKGDPRFLKSTTITAEDLVQIGPAPPPSPPTDELGVITRGVPCPSCSRVFRRKFQLRLHRAEEHGEPLPFSCSQCPAAFPLQFKLRRHIASVHSPRLYRCAYAATFAAATDCAFTTDKFSLLRKHHATGHPELRLRCAVCGKAYKRADVLRLHEETVHGMLLVAADGTAAVPSVSMMFACDRPGCSKAYAREGSLRTHLRNSHDEPRFGPCSVCGARFRHGKSFRQHEERCKKKKEGKESSTTKESPVKKEVVKRKKKEKKRREKPLSKKALEKKEKEAKKVLKAEQRRAADAYRKRLQRLPPLVFEEEEEENDEVLLLNDREVTKMVVVDDLDQVDHLSSSSLPAAAGGGGEVVIMNS